MINPSSRGLAGVFSSGDRHSTLAKTSPSEIIELMMTHPHVPHETRHALTLFRHLAEEVDMLRRYALLNFLAVTKVVKKHDKLSLLPLKGPLNSFVAAQPFHTGTRLLETFTSIRAFSSALVAMARGTQLLPPPTPQCLRCAQPLRMGVIYDGRLLHCPSCVAFAIEHASQNGIELSVRTFEIDGLLEGGAPPDILRAGSGSLSPLTGQDMAGLLAACSPGPSAEDNLQPLAMPSLSMPRRVEEGEAVRGGDSFLGLQRLPPHASNLTAAAPSSPLESTLYAIQMGQGSNSHPPSACGPQPGAHAPPSVHPMNANLPSVWTTPTTLAMGGSVSMPFGSSVGPFVPPGLGGMVGGFGGDAFAHAGDSQGGGGGGDGKAKKWACSECHKAKTACEGGNPCRRCVRLGKTCVSADRPIRRRRGEASARPAAAVDVQQLMVPDHSNDPSMHGILDPMPMIGASGPLPAGIARPQVGQAIAHTVVPPNPACCGQVHPCQLPCAQIVGATAPFPPQSATAKSANAVPGTSQTQYGGAMPMPFGP